MRIDRAKLKYELARRDMQQNRLSELTGISRATLSAIAGGKSCAPQTAGKIARALDMPVEHLIAQDGA